MLKTTPFDQSAAYKKLKSHHKTISQKTIKSLFEEDPDRHKKFSIRFGDIFLDYSKNRITTRTRAYLVQLAEEAGWQMRSNKCFRVKKSMQPKDVRFYIPL